MEPLLTAKQLAAELLVPLSYIRYRCHHKTIPFYKIGNHVRFDVAEVKAWLDAQRVTPQTAFMVAETSVQYGTRGKEGR